MASYFTPTPFLDEQTLGDLTKKCFLLKPSPKTLKDAAAAAAIWKALNAVYPAWFDQSVHPDACESPEVAVENMLYYMNEFLESKFQSDFDILKGHIPELLAGNPSLVLKLYEFILLISVQSDSQEIVARFMELSDTSQGVIRKVIQFYADDDESNSFSEVAALSKSWGSGVHTPQEEARGGPLAQRLQQQLAAAQQQLAAAKQQLAASETHKESILDKLKTTEQERDKERDKRITLEIQLERKKDSLLDLELEEAASWNCSSDD
ncbi:hypothetical protein ETH_00007030 [Eimeria tenella]|uniref:Uncharacterized protein n=1 Tax=Eimeria tenella TaxID=5802 RepID=U6L403_EIMTE|nr:hypothetical protein ETH_00007030 [Eimeria tenella]CDJ44901.1 hypothetical protein ETH_00007030 [Eimeria tenella]|eukprot:XP_013235648.1 hypothetical protein ETH_00007030 [Eimeria tenella]